METMTITFVLGALSGLFLLGMVYAFIGVLKTQKEIKNLKHDYRYVKDQMNMMHDDLQRTLSNEIRDVNDRIADVRRELDNINEQTHTIMGANNSDVHCRIDEVSRYIDSRLDKTIDVLCTRMDTMFVQKETDTTILKS
jgi:hypothetical protein